MREISNTRKRTKSLSGREMRRKRDTQREGEREKADRVSRLADFEPFETQVEIIQLCVPC